LVLELWSLAILRVTVGKVGMVGTGMVKHFCVWQGPVWSPIRELVAKAGDGSKSTSEETEARHYATYYIIIAYGYNIFIVNILFEDYAGI